jgi:hypothetical protein
MAFDLRLAIYDDIRALAVLIRLFRRVMIDVSVEGLWERFAAQRRDRFRPHLFVRYPRHSDKVFERRGAR